MRIRTTSKRGLRFTFERPGEGLKFIAGMNETNGNYESAAKLYRQAGDEEAAKRCDSLLAARSAPSTAREGEK